jgi:hypothetical protein
MSEVIGRTAWGARYRDGFGTRTLPATSVWLHHTVTPSAGLAATLDQDAARVRQVEDVGYNRFGGISYTFLITEAGRIFQGHSTHRIGAHTAGYNTSGIGISLIGNYENLAMSDKQRAALVWLLRHLRDTHALTVGAVLKGHYQVAATACPGKNVKPHIAAIDAESRKAATPPKEEPVTETPYWNIVAIFADEERSRAFGAWCQANGIATTRSGVAQVAHGNDAKSRAAEAEAERLGAVCPFGRIYTTRDSWRHVSVRTPLKPLIALPTEPKTWKLAEQTATRLVLTAE